jgi:regulator of replication initiation timing
MMKVEESITDIKSLVSSLREKVQHLESKVRVLEKENSFLRYKLHQVELDNSRLRERLSGYESVKKDSRNSHIPPSKQDLSSGKHQRTQSLREKSGKPSGGQPGHQGSSLEFSKVPDKTADYV